MGGGWGDEWDKGVAKGEERRLGKGLREGIGKGSGRRGADTESRVSRADDKTAAEYNLEGGATLHLVLALRGGGLS